MAPEADAGSTSSDSEFKRPPLPPRRKGSTDGGSLQVAASAQSKPTTAVSSIDISTLSFPDGSRGTFPTNALRSVSTPVGTSSRHASSPSQSPHTSGDVAESMSVMSFAPTMRPAGDLASLVAGEMNRKSRAWMLLRSQSATVQPFQTTQPGVTDGLAGFEREFDDIPDLTAEGITDDDRVSLWKSKLKHYMILSSAGKPIYSRHGDLSLINSSMGVVQTIISFYEGAKDPLQGFSAGNTRFVVSTEGPLYLVAISKLGESDSQLRSQLNALYMQILSTLTLPNLKNIFAHRPSTDLRKPLEGTESLLSSLADSFTKGSPSALLGALECLRLRKSQRATITNTFLKNRNDKLLYGLIVAGGKLVSVIRPRKHSLHPSDLQLIFNMLFESGGIKSGGGESWIPICLPAFNNSGYLYMYVSFFDGGGGNNNPSSSSENATPPPPNSQTKSPDQEEEIAIILISSDKESFYDQQQTRDNLSAQLAKNGSLSLIKSAAKEGRPKISKIAPGPASQTISHFLYKSRANVQFCMSTLDESAFSGLVPRRRLMSLYQSLHASMHARHSHLKVLHSVGEDAASLAWITPVFEFYCVAGPNISRQVMTQGANKIIQWAKKEEERLFIIGGGVF
ncbi:vacuolar fusion protein mon1 [Rhypophila decipiens]|uniref:Vacuolar fusion protein MON1 n=1 Tax=Rhypophila decipiens TaxID=261697 RepID=A0AAN6YK67_9PEZI|nr:vacuolar fusion protein mon1 [Rhypophila decipiens]